MDLKNEFKRKLNLEGSFEKNTHTHTHFMVLFALQTRMVESKNLAANKRANDIRHYEPSDSV